MQRRFEKFKDKGRFENVSELLSAFGPPVGRQVHPSMDIVSQCAVINTNAFISVVNRTGRSQKLRQNNIKLYGCLLVLLKRVERTLNVDEAGPHALQHK